MKRNEFPTELYEERVRRILAHYEQQLQESEVVAEDEAAFKDHNETVKVEKDG